MNTAILSSEPRAVEATQALIYFRRKDTKNNPVVEADKYRAVVVPVFTLPEAYSATPSATEGEETVTLADGAFQEAIKEAFSAAAGEILRAFCDNNKDAKEVDVNLFTFDAVVAKMNEQQTSQRLNSEQIATWYDASKTAAAAEARYGSDEAGKKKQASLKSYFCSLASNNPGIMPDLAKKMIAYVAEEDVNSTVAKALVRRLDVLSKRDTADDL